eukprot:TRINITY_DN825_c0_g7_i1.p1 TRINITY_DN825_c0_g7~~TRINITY_DN825_c0_g7_i1.p1  ORF type:complete len:313 (-),score=31.50 TRINITY_DN825_c0_g7_i1:245-1129(-)
MNGVAGELWKRWQKYDRKLSGVFLALTIVVSILIAIVQLQLVNWSYEHRMWHYEWDDANPKFPNFVICPLDTVEHNPEPPPEISVSCQILMNTNTGGSIQSLLLSKISVPIQDIFLSSGSGSSTCFLYDSQKTEEYYAKNVNQDMIRCRWERTAGANVSAALSIFGVDNHYLDGWVGWYLLEEKKDTSILFTESHRTNYRGDEQAPFYNVTHTNTIPKKSGAEATMLLQFASGEMLHYKETFVRHYDFLLSLGVIGGLVFWIRLLYYIFDCTVTQQKKLSAMSKTVASGQREEI